MPTVMNVARYVLEKCGSVTVMKLQKLVYYCQAWSLAWDDEPLFDEDFEAWANGPVCPELYETHKGQFRVEPDLLPANPEKLFTKDQIESMDAVLKYYGDKSPHWLSELTHKEDPWKIARGNCPSGAWCKNVISKESMRDYYEGLIAIAWEEEE